MIGLVLRNWLMLRRAPSLALSLTRGRTIHILLTCVRSYRRLRRRSWRGRLLPLGRTIRVILRRPRHLSTSYSVA
jgi:hypothetical protein